MTDARETVIAKTLFTIFILVISPHLLIWAINKLLPSAEIPMTFENALAALVFISLTSWSPKL